MSSTQGSTRWESGSVWLCPVYRSSSLTGSVTLSHCHTVTLSHCHTALSQWHTVTLSHNHTVTKSHIHTVTLSHCHSVTPSHHHTVTLSNFHTVTFIQIILTDRFLGENFVTYGRQVNTHLTAALLWPACTGAIVREAIFKKKSLNMGIARIG